MRATIFCAVRMRSTQAWEMIINHKHSTLWDLRNYYFLFFFYNQIRIVRTKTKRGAIQISKNGFTYQKRNSKSNKQYWRCSQRGSNCTGSAVSDLDCTNVSACGEHNHPPDFSSIKILKNFDILKAQCRQYLRIPVPQIYKDFVIQLGEQSVNFPEFE